MIMEGAAIKFSVQYEIIHCSTCGFEFAVPFAARRLWMENGKSFFCPNGHSLSYHDNETARLRKQLEAEQRRKTLALEEANRLRAERDHANRRIAAQKGQATKLRKRAANGVCPCCTRSFVNLKRHMDSQHPAYAGVTPDGEEPTT